MPRSTFAVALLAVVGLALGCGDAVDPGALGAPQLLTIPECQQLGGTPLFDPEDGRAIEDSCPDDLRFLGEFTEPFFGTDGGICCTGSEVESS